ncbi:MAG: hypothetical protein IT165_00870 [Bryobacterales bacterium]|nr:hypothetical protein [Bryobacterales bacterium]
MVEDELLFDGVGGREVVEEGLPEAGEEGGGLAVEEDGLGFGAGGMLGISAI